MSIIKGLIVKDLRTIKSYKSTIIYMIVVFGLFSFFYGQISMSIAVFMPMCFGMLGMSSFSYDNLAKTDKYVLTFPVDKKDIVKARYIYILLVTLFGTLFGFVLNILFESIKTGSLVSSETLINIVSSVFGSLIGVMLLQVFQIPVMYKFGAEKGRIIQMSMIVFLMIGISLITIALMKVFNISLDDLILMLKDYLIAIIGITVILLYIFSYKISCRIYKRKDI